MRRLAVDAVMRQKVAHAQALVAGLARADFGLVQDTATQWYRIGSDAEQMVHDTVAYTVLSERFRQVAAAMAEHARRHDLDAIRGDHAQLMQRCAECHSHLREERLAKEYPEKIAKVGPGAGGARPGRAG